MVLGVQNSCAVYCGFDRSKCILAWRSPGEGGNPIGRIFRPGLGRQKRPRMSMSDFPKYRLVPRNLRFCGISFYVS